MDIASPPAATATAETARGDGQPGAGDDALAQPQPRQPHARRSSRSGSISSSSVVTVKRSASLKDAHPEPSTKPHKRASPPPTATRRRSSAANGAADGIGAFRDGASASATVDRWSQTTAADSRDHERKGHQQHQPHHHHHPSFSRKLSITSTGATNGTQPLPQSPSNNNNNNIHNSSPSAAPSPRRARPRSPVYDPPATVTAPPKLPSLPPILLPSTVYDPNTPTSNSTNNSPSASSLFTPNLSSLTNQPRDYFNSKPTPQPQAQRPPSRTRGEKVLGKSPLGSPAILHEADARYDSTSGPGRPSTARRPSVATITRDIAQKPPPSAGHRQIASRDHSRSQSKEQFRSASRSHARSPSRDPLRSESNASARLDDPYQGTPPRTRERREKDKKTMLSRALQKANTAVLLDNAQNFEGAMEAYEDACKLLQQVMIRSSQEEDRRKLDAIVSFHWAFTSLE